MTSPEHIIVLGGGVAGHRCARELRCLGYGGKVSLISAEEYAPYDRTLLSKDVLRGDDSVELSAYSSYRDEGIELMLGLRADWLDPQDHSLGLSDGSAQRFGRLVICVGGRPVLPDPLTAPGVIVVRELAQLDALRAALVPGKHLAIIGAGFIGGEVATVATERGLEVTLVEAASQPLARVLGEEVGARVAAVHQSQGVKVVSGTAVTSVMADQRGYAIHLGDTDVLHADHVVISVGMTPNTEWLAGSGIRVDHGVITDAYCRTSIDTILAAGDCARWWHRGYGELCRVEHWDTANRHGSAAAKTACGQGEAFTPLPFFSSDQQGVKFRWSGYAPTWDDVRMEGDSPTEFAARYYRGGALAAVLVAGQPRVFAQMRRELVHNTSQKGVHSR